MTELHKCFSIYLPTPRTAIKYSGFIPLPLWCPCPSFPFFFNIHFLNYGGFVYLFIYLFIFGCTGSSLLAAGFLSFRRAGAGLWLWCLGFPLGWLLLLWSTGSRALGLQ